MAKRKFKYKERSSESVEKRAKGNGDRDYFLKDQFDTFTPHDGDNVIRILPPTWEDAEHFGFDTHVHYSIGADKGTFLSLQKMKREPCPIYEEMLQAQADGDEDYAKSLRSNHRVLVWLIDREKEEDGPKLWAMPFGLDKDIALRCKDKRTGEILNIDHPEEGYDVEFTKTGSGIKTKYEGLQISRRSCPLSDDDDKFDEWLEFIEENPLPSVLNYHDYDYIKKVFSAGGRPPPPSDDKKKGGSKGKSEDFPEPEELLEMEIEDLDTLCEDFQIELFADDYSKSDDPKGDFIADICKERGIDPPTASDEDDDKKSSLRRRRNR